MNRLKRFLSLVSTVAVLGSAAVMSVSAEELGGLSVTPLTDVQIENAAQNVFAEEVEPLGNGLKGSRITLLQDLDPIDNGNFVFPGHHDDRAKVIAGAVPLAGSTGVVFYVDLPSANKICFVANLNSPHDERFDNDFDVDMMQMVDSPYYVLPAEGGEWEEYSAGKGRISDQTGWGCIEFGEAFKGWVYVPWDSLWVDIGFEIDTDIDTLHTATMYPQKVGGEAGSLTFGPVYLATSGIGSNTTTTAAPTTTTAAPTTTTATDTDVTTEAPETTASTTARTSAATTSVTEDTDTDPDGEGGLPAGAIAAIVIGIVVVLAGAGAAIYFLVIRKKDPDGPDGPDKPDEPGDN